MLVHTRIGRILSRDVSIAALPAPAGGAFSSPFRQYAGDSGAYFRRQWWAGFSERGRIGDYAASTAARKRARGLPYDRVVLYESGELYARTSITPEGRGFIVRADVPYAKYLVKRYGDRILWLGDAYLREWQQDFLSELKLLLIKKLLNG